jgi:predicted aminopeptidase
VLNTFVHDDEGELAELLFHELTHRRLFFSGDTAFNEALATAVGQEGTRRWFRHRRDRAGLRRYERSLRREAEFLRMTSETHTALKALYASTASDEAKILQKAKLMTALQQRHRQVKSRWRRESAEGPFYDGWFAKGMNNARFVPLETYYELVPDFAKSLNQCGGDLDVFFAQMERLRPCSPKERVRLLASGS